MVVFMLELSKKLTNNLSLNILFSDALMKEEQLQKRLDRFALLYNFKAKLESEALFQACFWAENYRDFRVGAAVLAFNGKVFRIFGGANIMNGKGRPKVCAEQQAIKYAISEGFYEILVVCVVGTPQSEPDKKSDRTSLTLHPCSDCRALMLNAYRGVTNDTVIHTRTFDENGPNEQYTLQGLIEYHSRLSTTPVVDFLCGQRVS